MTDTSSAHERMALLARINASGHRLVTPVQVIYSDDKKVYKGWISYYSSMDRFFIRIENTAREMLLSREVFANGTFPLSKTLMWKYYD